MKIVDKFYGGSQLGQESIRTINRYLQNQLEYVRKELYGIFYGIIVNRNSRENAMNFLSQALLRNEKRAQMQSNEKILSSDGFMLNLLSVLQLLSVKIKMDKIDMCYPFFSTSRVLIKSEETRLKMTTTEAEAWTLKLAKEEKANSNTEPKFTTECFFLTLDCHHLSIIPCIRKYTRRKRAIAEYTRIADDLQGNESSWTSNPLMTHRNRYLIKRYRDQAKRLP